MYDAEPSIDDAEIAEAELSFTQSQLALPHISLKGESGRSTDRADVAATCNEIGARKSMQRRHHALLKRSPAFPS